MKTSKFIDNLIHGDDTLVIIEKENEVIAIICDGVSSSNRGIISSSICSYCITEVLQNSEFEKTDFLEVTSKIKEKFKEEFEKFYLILRKIRNEESYVSLEIDNQIKVIFENNEIFTRYLEVFNCNDFTLLIENMKSIDLNVNSSTTILFAWIRKKEFSDYYEIRVYNLGDSFITLSDLNNVTELPIISDLIFNKLNFSIDDTAQYSSLSGPFGNEEIKICYARQNSVLSLGSDGSYMKFLDYKSIDVYKAEHYTSYFQYLNFIKENVNSQNDFEDVSEKWYLNCKVKLGKLSDDFSLINIYLI